VQGLDLALSQKKIQGVCLLCFENERPPRGALGYFDWLFAGRFTGLLKNQVLTGKKGHVVYTPLRWNGETLHFLIVGGGYLENSGERPKFEIELLEVALKQAEKLKLEGLGIVSSDWGVTGEEKKLSSLIEKRKVCVLS
jgi:hypothetical protein